MNSHPSRPSLGAVLIVRDEAAVLPACLDTLAGLVDTIVIHDTGSTDGTPELAARLGATVTRGEWTADFAAARNAALAGCSTEWVLSIDADERAMADPAALRQLLGTTDADVVIVECDNASDEIGFTEPVARVFRPAAAVWSGRVHEQLVARRGTLRTAVVPRSVFSLAHEGYRTADARRAKAIRNAEIAQAALDEFAARPDLAERVQVARTLVDLGRSFIAAGRQQDAVDSFEAVREMFPGTPEWRFATDQLARLLLAAGLDEVALTLAEQLRDAGVSVSYCDWLAAQALAQLGHFERAWALLSNVQEVVDTDGLRHDPAALRELKDVIGRIRAAV